LSAFGLNAPAVGGFGREFSGFVLMIETSRKPENVIAWAKAFYVAADEHNRKTK
jgi:hypothetical protein